MSVFHTHVGDFSVRMARIPEREYTQGARTPRGLYMWGLAWHSCVGEEVGVNCMIFAPFAFDHGHTKRHQLGGATETFFHRFFMKKHARIMCFHEKAMIFHRFLNFFVYHWGSATCGSVWVYFFIHHRRRPKTPENYPRPGAARTT
jgi:hypothetical protein